MADICLIPYVTLVARGGCGRGPSERDRRVESALQYCETWRCAGMVQWMEKEDELQGPTGIETPRRKFQTGVKFCM